MLSPSIHHHQCVRKQLQLHNNIKYVQEIFFGFLVRFARGEGARWTSGCMTGMSRRQIQAADVKKTYQWLEKDITEANRRSFIPIDQPDSRF